jgi:hypothetical protein
MILFFKSKESNKCICPGFIYVKLILGSHVDIFLWERAVLAKELSNKMFMSAHGYDISHFTHDIQKYGCYTL